MATKQRHPHIYGATHKRERERLRPTVEAGEAYCTEPICLLPDRWIHPTAPWDLAHNRDTGGYRGPAHRRCNRSEGAVFRLRRVASVRRWAL